MSSYHFDSDAESLTDAIASLTAADPFLATTAGTSRGTGGVLGAANPVIAPGTFVGSLTVNTDKDVTGMLIDTFAPPPDDYSVVDKKRPAVSSTPTTKYRLYCLPTVLGDLSNLCLGLIGQGSTFCIKENCMVFHVGGKADVNLGDIHVMKTNEVCFVEPSINRYILGDDLYDSWMNERVVLDEWTKRMAVLKNTNAKVSSSDFQQLVSFARTAKKFKPSTPTTGLPDATKLELLLNDVFKVRIYERSIEDVSSFMGKFENKPTRALSGTIEVVKGTEEALESITVGLIATNNEVEKINHRVQSEIPILFSRQENLETIVGVRSTGTLPNYESPTLWSSISLLSDIITETRKQVEQGVRTEQMILKTDSTTVATKVAKELVIQEVSTMDKRLGSLREGIASNLKTVLTRMNRDTGLIMELKEKMSIVEGMINSVRATTNVGSSILPPTFPSELSGLEIKNVREQLAKLESSIRALESQDLKDAVKFARLGFRNVGEAGAWVERHQPGDFTYGLVVDVHMVFEHVYSKLNSGETAQSTITRLDAMRKLGVTNLNLGIAITSFDSQVPKVFSKNESSPHSKNDESFFDQIADYEAWDLTDYGYRDKILNQIHLFELSHKEAVHNHQAGNTNSALYNVASKSLTDSVAWIKSFFLYIDDTYDELTRNKFSPKRGWSLVTRLAIAILKDVGGPRNGVNNLWVVGQNARICTLMFYSVIRCHDIMERYKGYNFKSDPAISGEYVRFLVMNTGLESLHNLEKRVATFDDAVTSLKAGLKTLEAGLKTLDTSHKATAGSVGDLKGKIAELTKKVDKNHKGNNA